MQPFDLNKMWEETDEQAKAHYESVEGKVVEMAVRKSQNVLNKVVQVATWELSIGGLLMATVCVFFWPRPIIFWTALVCFLLLFLLAWKQLRKLISQIKAVPAYQTKKAVEAYISILKGHQNRINTYLIIATPVTFLAGLLSGLFSQGFGSATVTLDWQALPWLAFAVAALIIFIISVRKSYLPWSVGQYIEELEDLSTRISDNSR